MLLSVYIRDRGPTKKFFFFRFAFALIQSNHSRRWIGAVHIHPSNQFELKRTKMNIKCLFDPYCPSLQWRDLFRIFVILNQNQFISCIKKPSVLNENSIMGTHVEILVLSYRHMTKYRFYFSLPKDMAVILERNGLNISQSGDCWQAQMVSYTGNPFMYGKAANKTVSIAHALIRLVLYACVNKTRLLLMCE